MNDFDQVTVQILHSDPMLAAGLRTLLSAAPGFTVLASEDAPIADRAVSATGADVIVADFEQGLSRAKSAQATTTGRTPLEPRVLIFSTRNSESDICFALRTGVHGYLVQGCSTEDTIRAVLNLRRGAKYFCQVASKRLADSLLHAPLTERENDVLELLSDGLSNKLISRRLNLSEGTVKTHLRGILAKLKATSRTHAVLLAAERGLVRKGGLQHDPGRDFIVPADRR